MAKPLPEHLFKQYLRMIGWDLEKGSIDYNLYNQKGHFLCAIKINHGKGKKREVSPRSVRKVQQLCDEREIVWPPRKK